MVTQDYALTPDDIEELRLDLSATYMKYVKEQFRNARIIVPLMINDAIPAGNWVPGTGDGAGDIYAIDNYLFPYRLLCKHAYVVETHMIYLTNVD